jgi:acetyl esterase/lipase
MKTPWLVLSVAAMLFPMSLLAADTPKATKPPTAATKPATRPAGPKPTLANVPYGTHPKQVLDFYKAESFEPTPLVFFIHGGGWQAGNKDGIGSVAACLKAGISVVSVEYRFIADAEKDGVKPPVDAPLHDAARALQFVRSKAAEWNIDKTRVGASGGSAGACSSLWLAFHDDMADPKSADPIAHESTRLTCAAVNVAQTSLDPKQMREWTPNSKYGAHAFGIKGDASKKLSAFQQFYDSRDQIMLWIKEYSPYELVTADDPPVYLIYPTPPAMGQDQKDPTHTANFGVKLQEHCQSVGVKCELVYPGAPDIKHATIPDYLIDVLKKK